MNERKKDGTGGTEAQRTKGEEDTGEGIASLLTTDDFVQ